MNKKTLPVLIRLEPAQKNKFEEMAWRAHTSMTELLKNWIDREWSNQAKN